MIRRIGLLGGECTGKSSLASALADTLGACVVREQVRAFVELHGRAPHAHEQGAIMQDQIDAESAVGRTGERDWLIGDPAPLMTAVYSQVYFDDDSLTAQGLRHAALYDVLLWCDQDIPWVPDGSQRDGPDFRAREHEVIASLVDEHALPAVLLSGGLDERVHVALVHCGG